MSALFLKKLPFNAEKLTTMQGNDNDLIELTVYRKLINIVISEYANFTCFNIYFATLQPVVDLYHVYNPHRTSKVHCYSWDSEQR